jgi:Transposase DDE domain
LDCQRHFLTPWFWRVLRGAAGSFRAQRWNVVALVMVTLLMLFLTAPSDGERFEEARALWTRLNPHRRRVGKTVSGYRTALARLPRRALKAAQPVLRRRVAEVLAPSWHVGGWIPFAVDGSRLALPRFRDLERRFGTAGKGDFPQLWITSLVHLGTGVPWAWRFGRGDASERSHLRQLLATLPERGLVVADAGFTGYDVWAALCRQQRHFLIRLSSTCRFYADYRVDADFREGRA